MTLNQVDAINDQGSRLSLPLGDPSSGFLVQAIDGLDPVTVNVVSSNFARLDGEQYQSSRRAKRNIMLRLGLEPDYVAKSVRDLRNELYGYLLPKRQVRLNFHLDDFPTLEIQGRVESFTCPLFARDPVATASILCFNPDFYEPTPEIFNGVTNSTGLASNIAYEGSVSSGINFKLRVNRTISGFTIYHQPDGMQTQTMAITGTFHSGDIVELSTEPGNKYATLTRGGVVSSVLYTVSPYATWTQLEPGDNGIRVYVDGGGIPYTIEYTNKHGGL